jgi:transposase
MSPVTSGEVDLLELIEGEVVGTAKAARWLNVSEATVKRICKKGKRGKLPGAYQPSGHHGRWLIPTRDLENIKGRPTNT